MARTVLIFAYRRSRMDAGSTVMRAHQLARLVTPHLPEVDIRLSACSRREVLQNLWARMLPKGAVVFATKGVVKLLFPSTADILRRRNCVLCLDVVDLEFKLLPGPELQAACYISPSMAGVEILRERLATNFGQGQALPLILPILHNADERIYGVRISPQDRARIAYFGNPAYAEIPASVAGQIDVLDGSTSASFSRNLSRITGYNVHYAVRPDQVEDRIKPFTKGSNAAVLGALVMVNRAVHDAVLLLGEDYPFLLEDTSEPCIRDGLDKVSGSWGGTDWKIAQDRMAEFAKLVSPAAIAGQIRTMMTLCGK